MTLLSGISHSERYQVENDVVSHFSSCAVFFLLTKSFSQPLSHSLFAPAPHRADDIQFSTMESDMFAQQWRSTISASSSRPDKKSL